MMHETSIQKNCTKTKTKLHNTLMSTPTYSFEKKKIQKHFFGQPGIISLIRMSNEILKFQILDF